MVPLCIRQLFWLTLFTFLTSSFLPPASTAFASARRAALEERPVAELYFLYCAAMQGHLTAQFLYALHLELGWGIESAIDEARHFYTLAAQRGHPEAAYRLGLLFETEDAERARERLSFAASKGVTDAFLPLANAYLHAGHPSEAIPWLLRAAELGEVEAYVHLGKAYAEGLGVPRDLTAALTWYQRAANSNHPYAQWALGEAALGRGGFQRNDTEAFYWFTQAAMRGFVAAQERLAECYRLGIGVAPDAALATFWATRAQSPR